MASSTSSPVSGDRSAWTGLRLLLATVAGPIAWLVSLESGYVTSYDVCDAPTTLALHASVLLPLVIIAGGAALAWRPWRSRQSADTAWAQPMSTLALGLCAWFSLVVLATYVPVLMLQPCR